MRFTQLAVHGQVPDAAVFFVDTSKDRGKAGSLRRLLKTALEAVAAAAGTTHILVLGLPNAGETSSQLSGVRAKASDAHHLSNGTCTRTLAHHL